MVVKAKFFYKLNKALKKGKKQKEEGRKTVFSALNKKLQR